MSAIPAPYVNTLTGFVGGHYAVAQTSGAIAATPSAGDVVASIRWAPASGTGFLVLHRLKLGIVVASAVTTAVPLAFKASVARGFTVDFSSNTTAINLSTVTKTNVMLSSGANGMVNSQMGANGPRICTTAGMTGQTYTLDTAPFAKMVFPSLTSVTATGTAVALQAGTAWPVTSVYEFTGLVQHPVILSPNEGVAVAWDNAGNGSGTLNVYAQWEWAEVATF